MVGNVLVDALTKGWSSIYMYVYPNLHLHHLLCVIADAEVEVFSHVSQINLHSEDRPSAEIDRTRAFYQ